VFVKENLSYQENAHYPGTRGYESMGERTGSFAVHGTPISAVSFRTKERTHGGRETRNTYRALGKSTESSRA
jgi:hypothetical protein